MPLTRRRFVQQVAATLPIAAFGADRAGDWPCFRGPGTSGVADDCPVRESWNADPDAGSISGVRWRVPVPGLGHSSPIVWRGRIYLPSAIRKSGKAPLKVGPNGGAPTPAEDNVEQIWVVLCYDRQSGQQVWRTVAREALPRGTRHEKATHANATMSTDGKHLVAFFGSEGLYCYNLDGRLLWSRDLGFINVGRWGLGYGYGSSPSVYRDRVALLCDNPTDPFITVLRLSDGKDVWRVSRKGVCERSWGTPLICASGSRTQVITNGWPWIVSYDLETGQEIWRLRGAGDNPVPSPFLANGWIYVTNSHGGKSPIYAIREDARGDISLPEADTSSSAVVWSSLQGGSYISTPVVYGDYMYFGNTNGVVRCFESKTGKKVYDERLSTDAAIYASLVAADGKVFCASEDGDVYVLKAGPEFRIVARNRMGAPCYATPAISKGVLYIRTTESLIAIG
jgi:outer membrane protein assembly factor BamB